MEVGRARRGSVAAGGVAAALMMLVGAAWPTQAAVAPIGTVFRTLIDLQDKQIPLPQGDWVLVGDGFELMPSLPGGGAGDAIESVVLFRVEGNAVPAFIIAHRNGIGVGHGWGVAGDCSRDDIHAAVSYEAAGHHGFCGFVNHVVTAADEQSAPSWRQAVAYAGAHGLVLPPTWLMAGFRLSDAADVLDVRYHFDPALAGLATPAATSWSDSRWAKAAVAGMPAGTDEGWGDAAWRWAGYAAFWRTEPSAEPSARAVAVDGLVDWLAAMRLPVELGFRNRTDEAASLPMPWAADRGQAPIDVALRLTRLDELKARHVLSDEQYAAQRAIIEGDGDAKARWTARGLAWARAVSNQVTSKLAAFAADAWFTGSIATATNLVGVTSLVDLGRSRPIEWLRATFGSGQADALMIVDFAGAGIDRPLAPGAVPTAPLAHDGLVPRRDEAAGDAVPATAVK